MLWSLNELNECAVLTTDGEREQVLTTLFDVATWELRYFIVKPESFSSTPVMIAVTALKAPNQVTRALPIELTAQQVNNSPTIVMNMLMTPSTQKQLHACYALYQYWALSGYASASLPLALISSPEAGQPETTTFRDTRHVLDATVRGCDGVLGRVDDLLVDDDDVWAIRHLVVNDDTGEPGQTARIAPDMIEQVNWKTEDITVNVSRNQAGTTLPTQPQGEAL